MAILLLLISCGPTPATLHLSGARLEAELGDQGLSGRSSEGEQSPLLNFYGWVADGRWQDFRAEVIEEGACPADLPGPAACTRRAERWDADVVEWALLRDQGLQQGWTLGEPSPPTQQIELHVAVEAGEPRLDGGVI